LGAKYDIQIHFITKALCAWRPMVELMHEAGCEYFGDSRVDNLAKINDIGLSSHARSHSDDIRSQECGEIR